MANRTIIKPYSEQLHDVQDGHYPCSWGGHQDSITQKKDDEESYVLFVPRAIALFDGSKHDLQMAKVFHTMPSKEEVQEKDPWGSLTNELLVHIFRIVLRNVAVTDRYGLRRSITKITSICTNWSRTFFNEISHLAKKSLRSLHDQNLASFNPDASGITNGQIWTRAVHEWENLQPYAARVPDCANRGPLSIMSSKETLASVRRSKDWALIHFCKVLPHDVRNRLFQNTAALSLEEKADLLRKRLADPESPARQITQLELKFREISFIPPEIQYFTALETLDLSNNFIREVPKEIGHLTNLKELLYLITKLQKSPRRSASLPL